MVMDFGAHRCLIYVIGTIYIVSGITFAEWNLRDTRVPGGICTVRLLHNIS